jgi:hypothetical protein
MKKLRLILFGLLAIGLAIIVWQHERIGHLQEVNLSLRATVDETERTRSENEPLSKLEENSDELARLRKEHSELLRLRGEISRLREQLKSQPSVAKASEKQEAPVVESPVEIFTANLEADVSPGQTLIAGGWNTADGKKTFLFVESSIIDEVGNLITAEQAQAKGGTAQITFQTKFAELSKESLQALGLNNLLPGKNDSEHFIMDEGQSRLLFKTMNDVEGADILSTPRVTTLNGRQAQVSVLEEQVINNEKYYHGPAVDLNNQISADGRFVKKTLRATIKLENRRR